MPQPSVCRSSPCCAKVRFAPSSQTPENDGNVRIRYDVATIDASSSNSDYFECATKSGTVKDRSVSADGTMLSEIASREVSLCSILKAELSG